ncbi:MAG: hypothetical protein KGJ45_11625 [Elusimicrobia bacterium]|nr:hypothetical protein [Elusimicrobiota bacterium]
MSENESATGLPVSENGQLIYEPNGQVLSAYIEDDRHVVIIRGPIGSGTSSASCMKIYRQAISQRKSTLTGKRRSKWIIVRSTYPELLETTIKTWLDWFPEHLYGRMTWERPPVHEVRVGDVELDVIFLALDEAEDIKKLRSLEYTGVWFNELEFANKPIFDEAESRTGRFPSMKEGGSNWDGVIADMNAPPEDHWLPVLTGEVPPPEEMPEAERELLGLPSNWGYHIQPPALDEIRDSRGVVVGYKTNPRAENLKWLKPGYYEEKARGKTKAWIDSRLRNVITLVIDGDPVWPSFNLDTHVAAMPLLPVKGHEVIIGMDFGRRPCAVFMQEINNRVFVQFELRAYGASSITFAPIFKKFLEKNYPGFKYRIYGDPKGQDKGQAHERTSYDIFKANGIIVTPAPVKNNALPPRLAAVDSLLTTMHHGLPRFQISPTGCPTLKAAMAGRYHVKKNALGDPEPVKDKFSDVADCVQYAALGMGEGRAMTGLAANMSTGPIGVWKGRRSLRRVTA